MRLLRLENTPEGRVVSWLSLRYEEQMKMKMRVGRREKQNERAARLSRHSKTPEGREERLLEAREMGGRCEGLRGWNEEEVKR